jgi:hypothetical protein
VVRQELGEIDNTFVTHTFFLGERASEEVLERSDLTESELLLSREWCDGRRGGDELDKREGERHAQS